MNSIRCRQCKHYIEANAGEGKIYGCDRSKCVFEPTTKNNLGVDEVTALAEWTTKLTKASEEAYNKGYEAGMKAQEPISDILEDIYFDIEKEYEDCVIGKLDDDEMYPCFRRITDIYGVLDIIDKYIDKYKAETEE